MWFRNLLIYRLTQELAALLERALLDTRDDREGLVDHQLDDALREKAARPCASQELSTYGFVAPIGKGENSPLVHSSNGCLLIATEREERILPPSVIKDAVKEKVEEIEAEQMRKVFKKERDQIKDEIIQAFLPRAFPRKSRTYAAIDTQRGMIFVDSSSHKRAEDLLSTLREAIGSLPVRPLTVQVTPRATLTDWMKRQQAAEGFSLLDRALLCDTHEDGGKIAATHQDLTSEEIQNHLQAGKQVTLVSLAWQDKLSFVLDDKLAIKQLRFEDLLRDQAEQDGGDDDLSQQDASFTLMVLTLREFMPALIDALGGEEMPKEAIAEENRLGTGDSFDDQDDPLYQEAVAFVRETRRASISAIQRKLKIGYNRAAHLIEAMELAGIVTPMASNGSREVIHG